MRPIVRGIALPLVLAVAAGCGGKAEWFDGKFAEAKAKAKAEGKNIVLTVSASWCPSCHELERKFWNTRAGMFVTRRNVTTRVDYDTEGGQEVVARYNVLHLPTTLVLDAEGHELGRVVGFEGKRDFGKRLALAALGKRDAAMADLERMHVADPDDLQLALDLGEDMLCAGLEQQGIAVLENVQEKDPGNVANAYTDAARLMGRYWIRCRKDYWKGIRVFEDAIAKFPEDESSWGFRSWIGQALWDAGEEDKALAYFEKVATDMPKKPEAHVLRAEFLQRSGRDLDVALAEIGKAIELDPGDDWSWYVKAEILHAMKKEKEAGAALGKAKAIAPDTAIYLDRAEEWGVCKE